MRKDKVIAEYGSQAAVARALGIKQPSVSEWPDRIPELSAIKLDRLTNGKLKYDPLVYENEGIRPGPKKDNESHAGNSETHQENANQPAGNSNSENQADTDDGKAA